jgi:predicted glutamine amidotransferase
MIEALGKVCRSWYRELGEKKVPLFVQILVSILIAVGLHPAEEIPFLLYPSEGDCPRGVVSALEATQTDNCRMWGAISDSIPDGVIIDHLIKEPNSLKNLAEQNHIDGWGTGYYLHYADSVVIDRGRLRAFADSTYDSAVIFMEEHKPQIALAHVRLCSSGCCEHGAETIEDPHPFLRHKNGKDWSFEHNGLVSVERLTELIGEEYLAANPPDCSQVCPPPDNQNCDSEYLFLLLLKYIEEHNWNVIDGVVAAIDTLVAAGETGYMNFIMSDGENLWAFRKGGPIHTLYYQYNAEGQWSAAASHYPSESPEDWVWVWNGQLLVLHPDQEPDIILVAGAEIIVDNADPTFVILSGKWRDGWHPNACYGYAQYNNPGTGSERAGWRLDRAVPAGAYDVYVWKFEHDHMQLMATNARYKVIHRDGISEWILVDQSQPGHEWIYLGTYVFDDSHVQGVLLTDNADGFVIADAIKLVYVE